MILCSMDTHRGSVRNEIWINCFHTGHWLRAIEISMSACHVHISVTYINYAGCRTCCTGTCDKKPRNVHRREDKSISIDFRTQHQRLIECVFNEEIERNEEMEGKNCCHTNALLTSLSYSLRACLFDTIKINTLYFWRNKEN